VDKEKLGYIAGILDGEGSLRYWQIWSQRHHGSFGFEMTFYNTNRLMLKRIQRWIGAGSIIEKKQPNKAIQSRKVCYMLQIRERDVIYSFLSQAHHLLTEKKERAEQILGILATLYAAQEYCQAATQG